MGGKNKLKHLEESKAFANIIQPSREEPLANTFAHKEEWNRLHFKNNSPIVLELSYGKGEYSVGLARRHPEENFIGVDIRGAHF